MQFNNYNILRSHGSLKNETFILPENYGFITFSEHGSSRKSKLNDMLVRILVKSLNSYREASEDKKNIYERIILIFCNPQVNKEFLEYIQVLYFKNYVKITKVDDIIDVIFDILQKIYNDNKIIFLDNISLIKCKLTDEECIQLESNKQLTESILGNNKYFFDNSNIFIDIKEKNKILNDQELELLVKKIDDLFINPELNNYFKDTSFDFLINNFMPDLSMEKILKCFGQTLEFTTFYGPGSTMQNLKLNLIGYYNYDDDKCKKRKNKLEKVKKSGLASFDFLSTFDVSNLISKVPCDMVVNKNSENMIRNIFYIKTDMELGIVDVSNMPSYLDVSGIKRECSKISKFNDNKNYYKTLFMLKILDETKKFNNLIRSGRLSTAETRELMESKKNITQLKNIWFNLIEPDNEHYKHKHFDSFPKNKKDIFVNLLEKNKKLIKKEICLSTFNLYSFYNQIYEEGNNINNTIRSDLNNIIQNIKSEYDASSHFYNYDRDYLSAVDKLYEIIDKNLPDEGYKSYTSKDLKSLVLDKKLKEGIYLIPSCRSGDTLDETITGLDIFNIS